MDYFAEKTAIVTGAASGIIDTTIKHTTELRNLEREKMLEPFTNALPPEECARQILKGVEANKATIVVTGMAKFLWYINRLSPDFFIWMMQKKAMDELRKK